MNQSKPFLRRVLRALLSLLLIAGVPLLLIVGCQSKLIYYPRPYPPGTAAKWSAETQGRVIDFTTSQGRQRAFLQGNLKSPDNLWIVCGGNATVALEWSEWLREHAPRQDAWLLVDLPGYGDCEGTPNPKRIRESLKTAIPLAAESVGWPSPLDPSRLRFFGHSLGGAACLIAASDFGIQRGVLLSPFTSTMDMARAITGLPIGFLVTHRFDNQARLSEIGARGPAEVIILHGAEDEVIPVVMSRKLAADHEGFVRLIEIPGGRHNTLHALAADEIAAALVEIAR